MSGSDPVPFEGTPWVLASGVEVDGWEEFAPTVRFEGGTVSGSTGCNRFTGPYSLDGDTLELGADRLDADGVRTARRRGGA